MRALLLLGLLLPTAAVGQTSRPTSKPTRKPTQPTSKPVKSEATLRAEAGALTAKLVAVHAEPQQEVARLSIEVFRRGALVDRTRTLDVSRARRKDGYDLRFRFDDPPSLRGEAHLIRVRRGKPTLAFRYDPVRRKSERQSAAPVWSRRLASTGLTWGDLRGEQFHTQRYVFEADAILQVPPLPPPPPKAPAAPTTPVAIRRLRATPKTGGPARVLHVDAKRHVPILERTLDPKGKTTRLVWFGQHKRVGKKLRPFLLVVDEPATQRTSVITVARRKAKVPAYHFDPTRYHQR